MEKFRRLVRSLAIALVGVVLALGAGLLGGMMGPRPGMKAVFIFLLIAKILEMVAAKAVETRGIHVRDFDCEREAAAILKWERRVWLAWSAALVNSALVLFALGATGWIGKTLLEIICVGVALIWMEPLLSFVFCWPSTTQMHCRRNELTETDFPEMIGMLKACAKESGHDRRVRIFTGNCGISAFSELRYDGMLVSPLLLSILTREEFKQALLHEFAHLTCPKTRRELRWRRLSVRCEMLAGLAKNGLLLFAVLRFCEIQSQYQRLIEPIREREADARSIPPEKARSAVAAIAKSEFEIRFYEDAERFPDGIFNENTSVLRGEFEKKLKRCGYRWLEELENETDGDSHPTFSVRKAIYGVGEFNAFSTENDPEWICEVKCACELADKSR